MINRRRMVAASSASGVLTLSEESRNVNASSGTLTISLYYNDKLLTGAESEVTTSYSGQITQVMYNTNGKVTIGYGSNTSTTSTETGTAFINYKGCQVVFRLTQAKDAVRTWYASNIYVTSNSISISCPSISGSWGSGDDKSGTYTATGTVAGFLAYYYESGNYERGPEISPVSFTVSGTSRVRTYYDSYNNSMTFYFWISESRVAISDGITNYSHLVCTGSVVGGYITFGYQDGSYVDTTDYKYTDPRIYADGPNSSPYSFSFNYSVNGSTGDWSCSLS